MSVLTPQLEQPNKEQEAIIEESGHTCGNRPLRYCVQESLSGYFRDLNGHPPGDLYDMVIREVELPLLAAVMNHTRGNQSKAAALLGINRGTLRKKLAEYELA